MALISRSLTSRSAVALLYSRDMTRRQSICGKGDSGTTPPCCAVSEPERLFAAISLLASPIRELLINSLTINVGAPPRLLHDPLRAEPAATVGSKIAHS